MSAEPKTQLEGTSVTAVLIGAPAFKGEKKKAKKGSL